MSKESNCAFSTIAYSSKARARVHAETHPRSCSLVPALWWLKPASWVGCSVALRGPLVTRRPLTRPTAGDTVHTAFSNTLLRSGLKLYPLQRTPKHRKKPLHEANKSKNYVESHTTLKLYAGETESCRPATPKMTKTTPCRVGTRGSFWLGLTRGSFKLSSAPTPNSTEQ